MKNAILSLSTVAILTICMLNSVAATPVSKQTTDVHSNYAEDERGQQQTYLRISITGMQNRRIRMKRRSQRELAKTCIFWVFSLVRYRPHRKNLLKMASMRLLIFKV
jgi:hypothetical protein